MSTRSRRRAATIIGLHDFRGGGRAAKENSILLAVCMRGGVGGREETY